MSLLKRFVQEQSGATAIEYALIASLISIALLTGGTALGDTLDTVLSDIAGQIDATSADLTDQGSSGSH